MGRKPAFRRCPSSLYTFRPRPMGAAWLGIGTGARRAEAFPDFEQIRRPVSKGGAQFYQQGILCSILLSYADMTPAPYTSCRAGAATPAPDCDKRGHMGTVIVESFGLQSRAMRTLYHYPLSSPSRRVRVALA